MPLYQIVSVRSVEYNNSDNSGLYNMLSKKVSTLLLEGWKCQGGVSPIYQDCNCLVELIQAMTYES